MGKSGEIDDFLNFKKFLKITNCTENPGIDTEMGPLDGGKSINQ